MLTSPGTIQKLRMQWEMAARNLRRKEDDIKGIKAAKKNRLAIFGADVPRLVQAISENAHRFGKPPIGPIGKLSQHITSLLSIYLCVNPGNHITLSRPEWASPVEYRLRNLLNSFICSSAEDRRVFDGLCRAIGINHVPQVIVTR